MSNIPISPQLPGQTPQPTQPGQVPQQPQQQPAQQHAPQQTTPEQEKVASNAPRKPFMRKKPQARLKIGQSYNGKKTSYIAQGVVVFREWDPKDKQFYYWEEWELTGFNDYDSWVEYDHYTKKIMVFEPIDIVEQINARDLTAGQRVRLTVNRQVVEGTVHEVGVASVDYLKGKMSYQLFSDDTFTYATINTPNGQISIEDYRINGKSEKDYYLGRRLSKKQQKDQFGKVLHPINWAGIGITAAVGAVIVGPMFIPSYETVCTPRTAATQINAQDTVPSADPNQVCSRRRVFFSGGAGGGIGK